MHVQHVESCPDIGPVCRVTPQAPYQHQQVLYSNDLVLDVELGLLGWLSVETVFGLRQTTDRIEYRTLDGAPYAPPVPDFHHRNETLVGLVDPRLLLHAGARWGDLLVSARAGLTFPIGSTVPNPFVLGREGLPHQHIQFGDGTWDAVVGASIDRRFDAFSLSVWTLNRLTFGANSEGYQSGDKLLFGFSGSSGLGLKLFNFTLGVAVSRETAERWSGVLEEEGNLGRTDVLGDISVAWTFVRGWTAVLGLKVPFYSLVQGEQATYPAILSLGLATDFGASR